MDAKDKLLDGIGAIRLNVTFDHEAIAAETADLPYQQAPQRHPRNHHSVKVVALRRQEGEEFKDQPTFKERLPKTWDMLHNLLPSTPNRALLGQLAADSYISIHSDRGKYFQDHIRVHFVIRSNPKVRVYGAGYFYSMLPGEVWALRNLAEHGVMNEDPDLTRLHLISDFDPTPELLQMLAEGQKDLGQKDPESLWRLHKLSRVSRNEHPSMNLWYETQQFFQDKKRGVALGLGRMLNRAS